MPDESRIYFGDQLKTLDNSGRVGGYLVRFSDAAHKDLDGEYFTAETFLGTKDGNGVDTYFHHGKKMRLPDEMDAAVKSQIDALADYVFAPIKTTRDAIGIFAEVVLDLAKKYEEAVHGLVTKGALGWSSGAITHLVRMGEGGEIKRWPIGEASLTPTPAEPLNRAVTVKSLAELHFKMFDSVKLAPPDGQTFADHSETVLAAVKGLVTRAESVTEMRSKEGRVISTPNRQRLQDLRDALDALLSASEPKPKEKTDTDALRLQSQRLLSQALIAQVGHV